MKCLILDLYGFWIGCYILRVTYIGACFIINHIMLRRTDLLLNLVLLWIRNALLFSVWVRKLKTLPLSIIEKRFCVTNLQNLINRSPSYQCYLVFLSIL